MSVRVLPLPAPAMTSAGPGGAVTAAQLLRIQLRGEIDARTSRRAGRESVYWRAMSDFGIVLIVQVLVLHSLFLPAVQPRKVRMKP